MLRFFALMTGTCLFAAPVLAQASQTFPWLNERKIFGTNDLEPIEATLGTPEYDFSRAVARMEMADANYPFCTASRVGDGLFLTNAHCDHGCGFLQFRLGYERDLPQTAQRIYRCKALLRKSENLDFALYSAELNPDGETLPTTSLGSEVESLDPPNPEITYPVLSLSAGPLFVGEAVMAPQHPTGRFKEVDRSADCIISDTEVFRTLSGRDTIKHMCDTQGGSSGAPLIDQGTGNIVALHWGGLDDEFNEAIPMNLILDDLRTNLTPEQMAAVHVVSAAP